MDGNVLKALHGLECYQFLIAKVQVGGSWRVNKVQIVSQRLAEVRDNAGNRDGCGTV